MYYGNHTCNGENMNNVVNADQPQLLSMDLDRTVEEMVQSATEVQEFDEGELNMSALLEVLDDPLLNWEIIC